MKLLTKSIVDKMDKSSAKIEFLHGKLTVQPHFTGACKLRFPVSFTPYKTLHISAVAKKFGSEQAKAYIGTLFYRRGALFCRDENIGKISVSGDNYVEYKLRYFIPFGVDEAYVTVDCEGGAVVSLLSLEVTTSGNNLPDGNDCPECVADGGLSAYAPKNTMPAFLAAMRAGFKKIALDASVTKDGEIVCYDGKVLSSVSDGEGDARDKTLEQMKALDFGMFSNPFYKNTRISTLDEVLMQFSGENITPYIRISGADFPLEKLAQTLEKYSLAEAYVLADDEAVIKKAAEIMPNVKHAVQSHYYRGAGEANAFGKDVLVLPVVNYADELDKAMAAGEKIIVTAVYQLEGCKTT